jgi:hypothetical protein
LLPFKIENYAGKKAKYNTSVGKPQWQRREENEQFSIRNCCVRRNRNLQNFIICFAEESGTHQHEMMEKVLNRL